MASDPPGALEAHQAHEGHQHDGNLRAAVANAVVRVLAEYTGRGATRARATLSGDWVFVTLADTLTKGERKLAAIGRGDFVLQSRKVFQNAMRDEMSREVEVLMGRKVVAFLSDNHIDPDVALEAMMLEPAPNHFGSESAAR